VSSLAAAAASFPARALCYRFSLFFFPCSLVPAGDIPPSPRCWQELPGLDHKTPKRLPVRRKGCSAFSLGQLRVLGRNQNVAQGCKGSALARAGKSVIVGIVEDDTMKTTCNVGETKACGCLSLSLCAAGFPTPSFTLKTMKKRAESCLFHGLS